MTNTGNARKLLSSERESLILRRMAEGFKTVTELAGKLGVSEATVRRDLENLEQKRRLRRVHGGAELLKNLVEEPLFQEKTGLRTAEKNIIAELALQQIEDSDTIYLDGGSTVLELAKHLSARKNLTVVTNSLAAAAELMETDCRLLLVGGEFRRLSRTLVGPLTEKTLSGLRIGKAFLGTMGFSPERGMTTTDVNEAFTKELVLRSAARSYVLADHAKLEADSFAASGSPSDVYAVITDRMPSGAFLKAIRSLQIEIIYPTNQKERKDGKFLQQLRP